MHIEYLKLMQYRNYAALELVPGPRLTLFAGRNAQGKTNLVEAVFLLAAGRSHRTQREGELIQAGQEGAYARVDFTRGNVSRRVELKLYKSGKKQGKVDGAPVARMGDMIGRLNAVLFSPEDLRLVKNGPAERRRYMDIELSQMRPAYFMALSQYARALGQRNALLKEMAKGKPGEALPEFDGLLVQCGSQIIAAREDFIKKTARHAARIHAGVSGGERLLARYRPDVEPDGFAALLAASVQEDIRRGATQRGPHKDDIELLIGQMDARGYASQGQQRTLALSLKLAGIEMMYEATGEYPVLLLDDVMSELDETRRRQLLAATRKCQTFITCTDADKRLYAGAEVYTVRDGKLNKA